MKYTIKKYLILAIASLFIFSGCSSFLEEPDRSNFTKENYFTKPEHAESIINSIYENIKKVVNIQCIKADIGTSDQIIESLIRKNFINSIPILSKNKLIGFILLFNNS